MRENATIIALENDCVWVETLRQGSCSSCSASAGCGQGLMSKMLPGREHYIRALIEQQQLQGLAIGQTVAIEVPDAQILEASAVVYLVPLVLLIAGAMLGTWVLPGDAGAISGAVLGLLLGAVIVRWHARVKRNDQRFQPRVVSQGVTAETVVMRPQSSVT
jgi:sigma-E factor negative regulatory protein RseC